MRGELHDFRRMNGSTLIEALVSVVILSAISMSAIAVQRKSVDVKLAAEMRRARAEMRAMITSRIDCKRTLRDYGTPASCNGVRIPLLKSDGTVIVADPQSTIGDAFVRATCGPGEVRVELAHRSRAGGFAVDPFDRTTQLGWSHPARLLFPGLGLCTGEFASAPRIYARTLFPAYDPRGTTRGPSAWSRSVTVPYPVKAVISAVDGSHATNSTLGCLHNPPIISGNQVTFSGTWWHGLHRHLTMCSLSYIISAE